MGKHFLGAALFWLSIGFVNGQERDVLIATPPIDAIKQTRFNRVISSGEAHHAGTFDFIAPGVGIEGQTVKGAPFSAEAVNETTQVLADGNRISRKTSTALFRDGQGRTRREVSLGSIGPWATSEAAGRKIVMIYDPVADVSYTLDEKSKTARKVAGRGMVFSYQNSGPAPGVRVPAPVAGVAVRELAVGVVAPGQPLGPGHLSHGRLSIVRSAGPDSTKTEALGKRNIEGIEAEGTRTTLTIPAGQIGNERPMEIVTERWYSTELNTVVMTRHNDPMMGESLYKLTNLRRGEPLPLLFEVPSDYTITTEEAPMILMKKTLEASRPEMQKEQ